MLGNTDPVSVQGMFTSSVFNLSFARNSAIEIQNLSQKWKLAQTAMLKFHVNK